MDIKDARTLTPEAQQELRIRVVNAVVNQGMKQVDACRTFGIGKTAVHNWLKAYRKGGKAALKAKKRGRKPGSRLKGHQAATVVRIITDSCPDQLKLPFVLWTREAVCDLLASRYSINVSVWTAGRYLRRWGFTPQKPIRRAYERNPQAVQRWLDEEYPAIRSQAKVAGAEIHWGDEMGLRSDDQRGRTYSRKGHTPVVPATGQRFGCNMISTVTNHGRMAFMVFQQRFTTEVMITFLKRLVRHNKRPVYLIIDGHPVHRSKKVSEWVAKQHGNIKLFYLPGYSPELNPDEYLNQDVKSNAVRRPRTRQEMIDTLRSYLRSTQRRSDIVRAYFHHKDVRYAAAS